jgi:hypothetical protein
VVEREVYEGDHTSFMYSYVVFIQVKRIYVWVEEG